MKVYSVIPIEKRKNYRCHFCGTTRSVKYVTEIFDPVIDSKPTKVCCCNKCILLASEMKYPCIDCIYFDACGDPDRTMPCNGRETKVCITKSEKEKPWFTRTYKVTIKKEN